MRGVEGSQQCGIKDVIPGNPRTFFRAVARPIYQVLQETTMAPGVQDLVDLVDGTVPEDRWKWGFLCWARLCGNRNERIVRFEQ